MRSIIEKTFGGLSTQYYFRHFFFGLLFAALFVFVISRTPNGIPFSMIVLIVVNTPLYPYSRFVYESITKFIMGENVFFVNAFLMMLVKVMTMAICYMLAVFIAPVGLVYLYFHHNKQAV